MATGYGEFAKGLRQGSLNPQQWNAYLMQQNQIRTAYKQAFSELHAAAQKEGLNIAPPELRNDISQAEAQEKLKAYAEQVNKNLSYFDVDSQLNTIFKSATASGLNVPRPTQYGKTVKDAATAKVILDNYTKKVSQVALRKNLIDAVDNIRAQAAQQGVTLPGLSPNAFSELTKEKVQYLVNQYLKDVNNQIAVKSYNEAVSSISAQARAQGVTVAVPAATGITSANVQAKINQFAASVNNALLQKSVSNAIDSIYAQAKGYGVEVPKPSINGITQANAQTFVDNYLNKVNSALANQPVNVGSTSGLKSADTEIIRVGPGGIKPDGKVHGTGLVPVLTGETTLSRPEYVVRDDLGRQVTITESQLQQMQKAQANRKSSENFTVIPEEVANSQANWWINSQGLYEWIPVTASDKAHLERINKQRAYLKQPPKTTLTCGASPSAEYSKEWYSTGGNRVQAKVGSGDLKLQKIKASSPSININATAKTGTAQQAKATSVRLKALANPDKLYDKYGKEIKRVEYNKDAGTSTGSVKIYASKADLKQARIDAAKVIKEAEQIRKAYMPVEVSKGIFINPVQMKGGIAGTGENKVTVQKREVIKNKKGEVIDIKVLAKSGTAKEYAEALKNAETNALTSLGLTSGMLEKDPKTGQVVLVAEQASFKNVQDFKTVDQIATDAAVLKAVEEARKINPKGSAEYFAGVANVARRSQMSTKEILKEDWNRYEKSIAKAVSSILPDLDTIAKTRDKYLASVTVTVTQPGKKTRQYTLKDVQRKHQKAVKENVVTAGLLKFTEDEYTRLRTKPLTYAAETGLIAAGGAVIGAGAGGLKAVVSPQFAKVAAKTGSKPIKAVSNFAAKHGVDVVMVGLPLAYTAGSGVKYFTSSDYKTLSAIDKDAAQVQFVAGIFKMGKDMAIGYPGFVKGSKVGVKVTEAAIPKVSQGIKSTKIGIKEMLKDEKALVQVKRGTPQKMQPVAAYQQRTKAANVPDMLVDSGKGLQIVSPKIEKVVAKIEMDFDALMRMSDEEFNFLYRAIKNPDTVTIKKGQIVARTKDLAMFENTLKLSELKSSVRARDRAKMIQLRRIMDGVTPSIKFQRELKNISYNRGKNYITTGTDPHKGGASKIRINRNTKPSNRRPPTNEISEITHDIEKVKGIITNTQKQSQRTVPRTLLTHKPIETQKNTPITTQKTSQTDKQTTPNIFKNDLQDILNEISKLDVVNEGSGGGSGVFGGSRPPHKPGSETPIIVGRRNQKTPTKVKKDSAGLIKLQRKIQNAFGNLETMFGKSTARPAKKTVKKAAKRAKRA